MPNLVGIGNSQVPTNAMLGGLAYQDSVGEINLDKIKARTGDTAVDIFVYDTSKDSDGGAWRHRTQNTSWYNEGASATRGSRKEFPAVAVIVATDGIYTIYDGDDPNLPMWMVFEHDASDGARIARRGTSAITMLNGIMCATRSSSQRAAGFASFIDDTGYQISNGGKVLDIGGRDGLINRNVTGSFSDTDSSYALAGNGTCYDVAMTVLPNAPINSATGLPIPTIAIAHNSGISIITDSPSGVVYDLTANSEANDVAEVAFLSDNRYSFATTANNERWWVDDIQTADENSNYFYQRTTFDYSASGQGSVSRLGRVNGTSRGEDGEAIFRQASGMSRVRYVDKLINFTTSDYNTGWMDGDIKRALLSSTDSTDASLTARNLILNSTFTGGSTANWTGASNGVLTSPTGLGSYAGGTVLRITNTGGSNGRAQSNSFSTTVGKQYGIRVSFTNKSSGGQYRVEVRQSGNDLVPMGGTTTAGIYEFIFTSAGTGTYFIELYCLGNDGEWAEFDNVYVYEMVQDRSRKLSGLSVVGAVPVSPVADGAELMAYGPFSSNSHLIQDHSSDLDYGTGDFYYMIWVNLSDHGPLQGIWSRQWQGQSSGNRIQVQTVSGGNGAVAIYSGVNYTSIPGSNLRIGKWHHLAMVRRSGTMYWYKDGVEIVSYSDDTNYSNNAADLRLGGLNLGSSGQEYTNNHYQMSEGKLALFRTGGTGLSEQMIKKIYDDEKYLYRENAKCTLHGTSDDVKALAFDDTNNVLHVGTSSGRSEFQGLNRINNTTTAVTTAISASNGLVAEQ